MTEFLFILTAIVVSVVQLVVFWFAICSQCTFGDRQRLMDRIRRWPHERAIPMLSSMLDTRTYWKHCLRRMKFKNPYWLYTRQESK